MTSETLQKLIENTQHCLELLDQNNETLSYLLEKSNNQKGKEVDGLRRSTRIRKSPERNNLIVGKDLKKIFRTHPVFKEKPNTDWKTLVNLPTARKLTNLSSNNMTKNVQTLLQYANSRGYLTRKQYNKFFRDIIKSGPPLTRKDKHIVEPLVDAIYFTFKEKEKSQVHYLKLVLGLSVLSGGTRDNKVKACVHLLTASTNSNEPSLSLPQLRMYLTAVFQVLYLCDASNEIRMGVNAIELGKSTSQSLFDSYRTPDTNSVTLSSIKYWYQTATPW